MPIDLLFIVLLLFGLIHGWARGIIVQAFKLAALVGVWLFGFRAALPLAGWTNRLIPHEAVALVVAYGVVTLVALIVFSIAGELVNGLFVRTRVIGKINRLFGAGLGLAKGAIVVWLLAMALSAIPDGANQLHLGTLRYWRSQSRLYGAIVDFRFSPTLPAVRVRGGLTELRHLATGQVDPAIRALDEYRQAEADDVLGPFLTDVGLQTTIDRLIDDGNLIQLFNLPEVRRLMQRPDKQAQLWCLIRAWRETRQREVDRVVNDAFGPRLGHCDVAYEHTLSS